MLLTSFPKDYKFLEGTFGCLGLCVGGLYGLGSENCVRWGSGPLLYQYESETLRQLEGLRLGETTQKWGIAEPCTAPQGREYKTNKCAVVLWVLVNRTSTRQGAKYYMQDLT